MTCAVPLAACGSSGGARSGGGAAHVDFLNFSRCMRAHGVADFPDPGAQGGIKVAIGSGGINPSAPGFQSAQRTCTHLLPGGGPPAGGLSESQRLQAFRFARCMRAHGVPAYPDPSFQGGGLLHPVAPSGLNPGSPTFQKAARSCGNPV